MQRVKTRFIAAPRLRPLSLSATRADCCGSGGSPTEKKRPPHNTGVAAYPNVASSCCLTKRPRLPAQALLLFPSRCTISEMLLTTVVLQFPDVAEIDTFLN